ncbi:hypothetical protein [Pelagibacterium montanilacus]|uniref:hypothetical protein n=1 Tax=Pelagibacterium montanilacus TaxID=2185280 RepID=UPI000F8DF698|nr:hypothetical protein [Pelagibacterium montanilacus]
MTIKSFVSPIALLAGLAMTGGAAAQTSVGDQDISDIELPAVEAHCEALDMDLDTAADASAGAAGDMSEEDGEDDGMESDAVDADAMETDAMSSDNSMEAGATAETDIDLEAITLQDCIDAGLIVDETDGGMGADAGADADIDAGLEDSDDGDDIGIDADVGADVDVDADMESEGEED